ncbi:MAG: hypothetical protein AAF658_19760, partial [Myxococcota bacterium]
MRRATFILFLVCFAHPARAGDWGLDAVWSPKVIAMGETEYVVENVLRYDDPENPVGARYLRCSYPEIDFAPAFALEYAVCPYTNLAPDVELPASRGEEAIAENPAKRIEHGFQHCKRWVVRAPALTEDECTPAKQAEKTQSEFKAALAKRKLKTEADIRTFSVSEAPADILVS